MIKPLLKNFLAWTKPFVWRLANAYDVRVDRPRYAAGDHPLIIEDSPEEAADHIPKSVIFNTRSGAIRVGKNTIFGYDVLVLAGTHLTFGKVKESGLDLHHLPESGKDIDIGSGCFIGSRAILIGPVKIGDYAAVGTGAVVTKDVPPYTLVAGSPARVIRRLDQPPAAKDVAAALDTGNAPQP